jgi:hypothetical protein
MTPMPRWFVRALALLAMLALPVAAIFTGGARLVPFLAMPLFVLGGPMLLGLGGEGREPGADTGDDSDSDDGPGGNKRPDRRPPAPSGPVCCRSSTARRAPSACAATAASASATPVTGGRRTSRLAVPSGCRPARVVTPSRDAAHRGAQGPHGAPTANAHSLSR